MVRFKVLGALEVMNGQRACTPTPPKVCRVLALLLLRANQLVHIDSLIEELWGLESPPSAVTTVQTYIYHLRKLFERDGICQADQEILQTRNPCYILRVDPEQIDAQVFGELAKRGQMLLGNGRHGEAADVLRQALGLWSGPALATMPFGSLLQAHVIHLEEQRINALEMRVEADMRLGRHRELVGELRSLAATYPLNEWFHGQLMTALSRSGRRGEALQCYQHPRQDVPVNSVAKLWLNLATNAIRVFASAT